MTKRYTIFNEDEIKWIWDSKRKQMFRQEGELVGKSTANINMLEKFIPFLSIEKQTNTTPSQIFDEKENRNKKLGL